MGKFKIVWFWDSGVKANPKHKYVASFFDDSQIKPSLVSGIPSPNHSKCHSFNHVDEAKHMVINMVSDDFIGVRNLWYIQAEDMDSVPNMRSVIAYADNRYANGTVLSFDEAVGEGIKYQDSVGFVRWFVDDSRIQQIYVNEEYRRQRISIKLVAAADLLIVSANDWNGIFLNGGDITTDDGEALRGGWSGSRRVTPRVGTAKL